MKILKNALFILLSYTAYSQHHPELGPDQTLPYGTQHTTLTANLNQPNPHETTNYNISNITYTPQANTGTSVNLGDNTQSGPLNIGFNFCFFGQSYSQFYICSNGWISFTPQPTPPPTGNAQSSAFAWGPLPNSYYANPVNCIFGVFQDWNPISTFGGSIKYQTQGTAPNRKLIVSWVEVPLVGQFYNSSNSNNNGNFHIILYESSNIIETHIQSKPAYTGGFEPQAIQGLSNPTGTTTIITPGRNATIWSAYNDAHRWTPSGNEIIPTLVWYEVGNPTPIAFDVLSVDVFPPINGAYYTCHLEYISCDGNWTQYVYPNTTPDTIFIKPTTFNSEITPEIIEENLAIDSLDSTLNVIDPNSFISEYAFYIPNSFTPNGDEYNNTFYPVFSSDFIIYDFHFTIFNRWGEIIFESFDYTSRWDGSYHNTICPSGVYVYIVEINNQLFKGHFNLIK